MMMTPINIKSSNHEYNEGALSCGIYIYGAGELGKLAVEYCEACGINVIAVLDNYKTGVIKSPLGMEYQIFSPDEIADSRRFTSIIAVAIATMPFTPISNFLMNIGWKNIVPFYSLTSEERMGHPLKNGWLIRDISPMEHFCVSHIMANWSDVTSEAHYNAFISWHSDHSELSLVDTPIKVNERYVINQLLDFFSCRNKQFIDVGSHDGGVVKRLNATGVNFSEYILIEPDLTSRKSLYVIAEQLHANGSSVKIFDYVISDCSRSEPFIDGLGYCSQIWSGAADVKNAVSIDELNLKPDFIKIHTEGSELKALMGAKTTIKTYHPALAFSVYHTRNGFCNDIYEAMKEFHGYRWYFRLHSYQGTGAFVYAIPIH